MSLESEIEALRRKCDEALAACASETCAMAQKLAAVTKERDELKTKWDYYQKLCKDHGANGIGSLIVERDEYRAALVYVAYDEEGFIMNADAAEVLDKYAAEDPIERARRQT